MDVPRAQDFQGRPAGGDGASGTDTTWLEMAADSLKRAEPERYFSALLASPRERAMLLALYAFNHVLAQVPHQVSEPMLGEIRLQWWRETLERAAAGDVEAHPVVEGLVESGALRSCGADEVSALASGWSAALYPAELDGIDAYRAHLEATDGCVMALAAKALGLHDRDALGWCRQAGAVHGFWRDMSTLPVDLRAGRSRLPLNGEMGIRMRDLLEAEALPACRSLEEAVGRRSSDATALRRNRPTLGKALLAVLPFAIARGGLSVQRRRLQRLAGNGTDRADLATVLEPPGQAVLQARLAFAAITGRV